MRWMWKNAIGLLFLAFFATACGPGGPTVAVITVNGLWDEVRSLQVQASIAGKTAQVQPMDLGQFGLTLPPGAQGTLTVTATAISGALCQVGSGMGSASVYGEGRVDVTVALTQLDQAQCPQWGGVWGSAARDVWAVGVYARSGSPPSPGRVIAHWDGSRWSISSLASNDPASYLSGVWGSGPNDVWAVGGSGNNGTILHWDGSQWSPALSDTVPKLQGVWASGPTDVWAGAMHWDGRKWTLIPPFTDPPVWVVSVWGSGPNDVWAGLFHSGITHWDGSQWNLSYSSTAAGIWGSGPNDVWAVGGGIIHWNGTQWSPCSDGGGPCDSGMTIPVQLLGVWGSGANGVWAVGESGEILHWDGTQWSTSSSGTTNTLRGVWGSAANDVWAVGDSTILHWDGSHWSPGL